MCAPYSDGYPDMKALADYLCIASARALAAHHLAKLREASMAMKDDDGNDDNTRKETNWALGAQGTRIRNMRDYDAPHLVFAVEQDTGSSSSNGPLRITASSVPVAAAAWDMEAAPTGAVGQSWTWTPSKQDSAKETLENIVTKVLQKS
ncbi:hypothetical protein NQ176_g1769 [Zarea fungicola]|uniref:Uncharacterized protein n=1 Tax=Zarea fungicola TaxID=93591 RepID=A0ACC1NSL8_9HYPO|nr:hypothetical protein NQ176_g1769 [Lecanicillium fungicola]